MCEQATQTCPILQDLRDGDQEAFSQFVRDTSPSLLKVAARWFRHQVDREDLVQDVLAFFCQHFQKIVWGRYGKGADVVCHSGVRAFLVRRAKLWGLDRVRRKRPDALSDAQGDQLSGRELSPAEQALQKEQLELIDRLVPEYAEVLKARCFERLTIAQIAKRMDLTVDQVKYQWKLGSQLFRQRFSEEDGQV